MDISCKVANRRLDSFIQRTAVRQMPTEAHPGCADTAIASRKRQEVVDAEGGVLVVSGELLWDYQRLSRLTASRKYFIPCWSSTDFPYRCPLHCTSMRRDR